MPTFSKSLNIDSDIGEITAIYTISAAVLSQKQISFRVNNFEPQLPPGMSVKKCTYILLDIEGLVELETVNLQLALNTDVEGSPCTGQGLDAQEWSKNGNLVVIGTEDGEALSPRFPKLGLEDKAVVEFSHHSMTLKLSELGKRNHPSFHFIIAENDDPETIESSAWFAVDQSHSFLLDL